ncbi:MAG: Gfo/Idh/MocA family oxidoreductase [Solirubrobacteraceae bacterium]
MSDRIRWGFIGASTIAREFMVNAVAQQPDGVLQAIFSTSAQRRQSFVEEYGFCSAYATLEELLADEAIDAVYISTTNDLHAAQAIAAATASKHVLCEKPLATNIADAEAIGQACREAGVVLAVNHHLPNAATHRAMRGLIERGELGQLRAVRVFHARWLSVDLQTWRTGDASAGAGVILDVTVHDAALLRFLMGEPIESVIAESFQQGLGADGIEDAVMGVMVSASGVPIGFHDAWTVAHAGTGLEIHGSEASAFARESMTSQPVGEVVLRRGDRISEVELEDREDLYVRAVRRFHQAVREQGTLAVSGEDGIEALRVALATAEAARTGRRVAVESIG